MNDLIRNDAAHIEEKALKIYARARNDLIFTFKLIPNTKGAKKDSYALYIKIPINQDEVLNYVLVTTQGKEVRFFKDLDLGKNYIQQISPTVTGFNVVIGNTSTAYIERKKYDRRKS